MIEAVLPKIGSVFSLLDVPVDAPVVLDVSHEHWLGQIVGCNCDGRVLADGNGQPHRRPHPALVGVLALPLVLGPLAVVDRR